MDEHAYDRLSQSDLIQKHSPTRSVRCASGLVLVGFSENSSHLRGSPTNQLDCRVEVASAHERSTAPYG
jgi:hypothetical protein